MTALFFIFGLIVGSFLNSVICRLKTGESIIKARSHCPYCKKTLSWFELIPLMSFIFQGGKCRHCKKQISLQYPLVELATGILFSLCGWYFFSNILLSVFYFFVSSCLVIIFVYDLKHYIIPDQVIYPAITIAFLFRILNLFRISNFEFRISNQFLNYLTAAIIAKLFFLIIVLTSRGRWMGMGDVKLAVFMGLVLGWPKVLAALFLAFLIGAFVSIILIIFKKKTLKSKIPFGPFLAGATIITIFFGDILINWYLKFFI